MAQQSSRLDIIIDSRTAKQNADQLRVSLDAITAAGTKAATSAGKFGTAANAAAAEIARLNAAARAGAGSNSRFGSSAAVAAAEVARLNASTAAGAANNARFGAAATAAAAAVAALKAQSAASTATIVRMGAASDAATAAIVRLDRANGSAIVSSRGLTASSSALGGALGGIGAALAAKEILSLTDRYKTLQGQLALVSSSNAEAAQTFETLRTMSNNTGSSLDATVKLYTRFSNATRGAGFSQDQLLKATDAVNKAFLVSSATTQEATAASVQLSQAMASGVLRGEELNSVMEQAPRITRALSEYLGVATGQIRAMAAEGKITSDIVMNALLKSLSSLNKEVATMPLRFEQASQALKNNFLAVIGQVNVDPVIDSVKTLADTLADPKASEGVQSISRALVGLASAGASGLNVVISNVDALIAITGVYAARVVGSLALSAKARISDAVAADAQIVASRQATLAAANEALAVRSAAVASAEAAVAQANYSRIQAAAAAQSQASSLARMSSVTAQLAADRALETQRLQAQVSDAGRQQSLTRLAEIRLAEAATTRQQVAAEAALVVARAEEVAANTAATAALARLTALREASIPAVAAATAAQNSLNTATLVGARGLALIGGPLGAITLAATLAAGAYLYFSSSADAGTASLVDQNLALGETIDKFKSLSAEQQRLQKITWAEQQAKALEQASSALDDFAYKVETGITLGKFKDEFRSMIAEVEAGKRPLDSVTQWIETNSKVTPEFRKELAELAVAQQTNSKSAAEYGEKLAGVNAASQVATQSADALKFAQRESAKAAGASAATWDKYIDGLTKSRDLVGANAAAEAAYTAVKMGANAAQQEQARAIANQTDLLEKYRDAVKTRNTAEMESQRIQITAAFTAVRAAEDAAEAKKKADLEAAQSAEDSATRQVNAMQRVIDKSLNLAAGRNLLLVDQPKQGLAGGVDLLTNGKGYTAPVAAKKTVAQQVQEALDQITTGVTPNKAAKTPKGPSGASALSAAMSTFDALYKKADPAAEAVRTLTKTQEQLELAQSKGKITQEQYGVAMAQASRDYAAVIAKTGELTQAEQYRLQIQSQLANQQAQVNQYAAAVGMGDKQADRANESLKLEKDKNDRLLQLSTELANAQGDKQRKALQDQIDITNEMYPQQVAIMEAGWLKVDAAQANWMNGITAGWDNYQAKVQDVASQTESIMTGSLDTITTGFGGAFSAMALDGQSFGEVTRSTFESLTRGVLDGLGQMAAQWLINQGLQLVFGKTAEVLAAEEMARIAAKTAAETTSVATVATAKVAADGIAQGSALASIATTLAANVSAAATTVASWLPAALVASIGSFGAAAVVGGTALVAAYALLKGFSGGGYTGPGGVNDPAGIVHKGEVVWSQEDIRKFGGVASVEALRKGEALPAGTTRSSTKQNSGSSSGQVSFQQNVNIHDYNSNKVEVRQKPNGDLDVIIKAVEGHLVGGMRSGAGDLRAATKAAFNLKDGTS